MKTLLFLFLTILELFTIVLLLRIWMQWVRCDFYNPFSQIVVRVTQPITRPLRRFIPALGPIDTASFFIACILCIIKAVILFTVITFQQIIWIAAVLILLKTIGLLIFWILLLKVLISWIKQEHGPIEDVLIQLTEPILRPIRNFIPLIDGIDFSPMILIILLYIINMGIAEFIQSTGNVLLPGIWMALWMR